MKLELLPEARETLPSMKTRPVPLRLRLESKTIGVPPGEFHFYVGNAMFQLGRVDGAVESWERCRDAKPRFAMVYNNLALAYWKQGRLDDAVAALDKAGELGFPVNPDFRADLTRASAAG